MNKPGREGLSSLVIGLVSLALDCGIFALLMFGSRLLFGTMVIILPIAGVVSGIKSFRLDGVQKILGIAGIILNVLSILGMIGFVILLVLARIAG